MGKINIKNTELVWPDKYDEEGKIRPIDRSGPYPFQIVENINSPRIGTPRKHEQMTLYDTWKGGKAETFEDGWSNKLIWGDNKLVMSSLLERFAGKIDLIYIDPPFATGADFRFRVHVGDEEEEVTKEHSILEEKAYRDTWGRGPDSYLSMMYERLSIMSELLAEDGSIYVHTGWQTSHFIRNLLEEMFGAGNLVNEIVWQKIRTTKSQTSGFGNVHDNLYLFTKGETSFYKTQRKELDPRYVQSHYRRDPKTGRLYRGVSLIQKGKGPPRKFGDKVIAPPPGRHWIWSQERIDEALSKGLIRLTSGGRPEKIQFFDEIEGDIVDDLWTDIYPINSQALESLGYATQKPEALLRRIVETSSEKGDLVADFFCGTGTTLAVAEKMGRRWIGCDLSRYAIHLTRKRLLEIENSKDLEDDSKNYGKKARAFEILNLGRYERQLWQIKTFNQKDEKQVLYEYLAFMLRLYGAEPLSGFSSIHGKKGSALVYVGSIDSPVTIQEILDAISDCKSVGQNELHVLGWEWEMGLNDAIQDIANKEAIKLKLRLIPHEVLDKQAVERGDIRFFELAHFRIEINGKMPNRGNVIPSDKTLYVKLTDFVIPHTDLIPKDVRDNIKKWSDWIDYWALDFDFKNDTFHNGWVSYRTNKNRNISLKAGPYTYKSSGKYKIFVKIIDIFGIDTSQIFEVEVP
jgi:adenine-specific DNA-methyltransferase